MELSFVTKKGPEIEAVFDDLARLRIAVFRDFPYLYEGSLDYEREYLRTYPRAERSFLLAVYQQQQMVGATTCLPLLDETDEIRQPFEAAGFDLGSIFYFGESILLPAFRGQGLGHRFFDEREAHAARFGTYQATCFCSVERPANHPARPADYRSNDAFWTKRGYRPVPSLQSTLSWPDLGETRATPKTMQYWMRPL
ncbi:GNAT family N-acetyltransferase [Rhabdobacter roseus]|uniref:GNAT superfamily N-acetyltransferase n=1 Tax=Rhabdobacter roseus TaxID=1655419 RepID=A0A840TNT2_9BACT|nr:GNAT family N-acetyltransferase [Rhabdobacter roseus]MBB5282863.1 GNAT superfamily N-acetyltransferase [Rhabdobacter roseus]